MYNTITINMKILKIKKKGGNSMEKIDRDEILLKIYEEQKKMQVQIKDMQWQMEDMQEKISVIPDMQEQINGMQGQMEDMQEKISVIPAMQEDIRNISRTVAKIEVEHGQKLDALFDAFTMHSEKLTEHEKRMDKFQRKIEKHDDEIYYLKSKVQGL